MTDKIEYKHSVLVYIIICLFYSGISYICVNCDELSEQVNQVQAHLKEYMNHEK